MVSAASNPGYMLTIALLLLLFMALPKVPQAWYYFLSSHLIPLCQPPIGTFHRSQSWISDQCPTQRHRERSIFWQYQKTNTETHNWTTCRKWEILKYSVLNEMTSSNIFPQVSGRRGGREVVRTRKHGLRKQHLPDITGLMDIRVQRPRPHAQGHTGLCQMGSQCWEREVGMDSPHF